MSELRQKYWGDTIRPVLSLTFLDPFGTRHTIDLLADTGCPYDLILNPVWFDKLVFTDRADVENNFGVMKAGWLRLYMPEMGLVEVVNGYGSPGVGEALAAELPNLAGLVGLPILRLGQYGGNASEFWFRYPVPE